MWHHMFFGIDKAHETGVVEAIVSESGVQTGLLNVFVQGDTAGIMILFYLMTPLFAIQWA